MPLVSLKINPPVARFTLAHPPVNVINLALMEEALAAIRQADWKSVRCCILSGEGKSFSAGVDVGEHVGPTCEPMIRRFHELFRALVDLPCALVARVQGNCLGGAAELLLACDSVVVTDDSKIGFPEIRLGVFPPVACAVLRGIVGETRARRLILSGETITGRAAAEIGLATRSVPAAELDAAVEAEASLFTRHSAAALRESRRALADLDLTRIEEIYLGALMKTADASEGLNAFLEKRPPQWKDR
ncbi:MAG: enoyl-CoA hydratase/isomerase family protein [Planctomycetota bacterium]